MMPERRGSKSGIRATSHCSTRMVSLLWLLDELKPPERTISSHLYWAYQREHSDSDEYAYLSRHNFTHWASTLMFSLVLSATEPRLHQHPPVFNSNFFLSSAQQSSLSLTRALMSARTSMPKLSWLSGPANTRSNQTVAQVPVILVLFLLASPAAKGSAANTNTR
jgi:hypothetical protein